MEKGWKERKRKFEINVGIYRSHVYLVKFQLLNE